mgnify:CR=1 FL=1
MKKLMMTMIAAVMMSSAAFAQDNQKECKCSEKKADNTEMVKHRTDKMVKKYGLNDQQAAQLLEVNTKYSDKMEPRGQHHHPGKGRPPKDGKKMDKKTDGNTGATAQQTQESKRQELTEEQRSRAKSFSLSDLVQRSAIPLGLTCMIFYFGYSGVLAFIMQYTQGTAMEEAGYYFYLAVAVGTLISRFTTGRIYDSRGANPVVLPGYVSFITGMIIFASTDFVPLFMLSGFLMGYGISIIYAICQAIVVTSSPAHRYGVTSATFGSLSDMGSGFGPFILGSILAATGYHQMYLICAGVSFCSLFMYWAIHGHKEFREKHPEGC